MVPPDGGLLTAEGVCGLRTALVAAGYRFIPEITGGKFSPKPYSEWRKDGRVFDPAVTYCGPHGPLLNTALVCVGLVIIDLDIDDASDIEAANEIMHDCLGDARCVRHRAGSPRQAAAYRTDDLGGLYALRKGAYGMVELFSGALCKVTAFGVHTDKVTGVRARLTWDAVPGNVAVTALTPITLAQARSFLDAVEDVLGADISRREHIPGAASHALPSETLRAYDLDEIGPAMRCVPNTGPLAWEEWNRVGMMLYGASAGDDCGLLSFYEWTYKNPHSRHRDCIARWDAYSNCPPVAIGAGSLFQQAFAHGYRRPASILTPVQRPTARQTRASQRLAHLTLGDLT